MICNLSIMHSNTDIISVQAHDKFISGYAALICVYEYRIEMKCVPRSRPGLWGQFHRQLTKGVVILIPDFLSPLPVSFYTFNLVDAYSRLKVHHIVLKSDFSNLIM